MINDLLEYDVLVLVAPWESFFLGCSFVNAPWETSFFLSNASLLKYHERFLEKLFLSRTLAKLLCLRTLTRLLPLRTLVKLLCLKTLARLLSIGVP